MFGFLRSNKLKKARKQGKEWVHLARKVDHFRCDVMAPDALAELRARREGLEAVLKRKEAGTKEISAAVEELEKVLRRTGGDFYPRSTLTENVDMIVVAAILAIGIRTFFLQPFKIPTNSMYPTYNGLTTEVYFGDERPSLPARIFRIGQLGAGHRDLDAGEAGEELLIPVATGKPFDGTRGLFRLGPDSGGYIPATFHPSAGFQRFLVLPGPAVDYTFLVGDEEHSVRVPADFPMDHVLQAIIAEAGDDLRIERGRPGYQAVLHTGIRVPEDGAPVLSFDVKSGDMLFVDRFTYNFRRPQAGEPFVFSTDPINIRDGRGRVEEAKYYIKRLAGEPGDVLEVRGPALYRNGEPADAAEAFVLNAAQEGAYEGYLPRLPGGGYSLDFPREIPADAYFALGDNSDESLDSRAWGFVPEEAVVGRAILIYYPFSHRWGVAE